MFLVERLPGPLVQLSCHLIEFPLWVRQEVEPFREIQPQESVGVSVRAALVEIAKRCNVVKNGEDRKSTAPADPNGPGSALTFKHGLNNQ